MASTTVDYYANGSTNTQLISALSFTDRQEDHSSNASALCVPVRWDSPTPSTCASGCHFPSLTAAAYGSSCHSGDICPPGRPLSKTRKSNHLQSSPRARSENARWAPVIDVRDPEPIPPSPRTRNKVTTPARIHHWKTRRKQTLQSIRHPQPPARRVAPPWATRTVSRRQRAQNGKAETRNTKEDGILDRGARFVRNGWRASGARDPLGVPFRGITASAIEGERTGGGCHRMEHRGHGRTREST